MAYENFIGTVESAKFVKELEKNFVLAAHCSREYEGEVKGKGDTVRVPILGTPTIWTLQKDGTYAATSVATGTARSGKEVIHKGIPALEEIESAEVAIPINELYVFNYGVGDIDKELTKTGGGILAKTNVKRAKGVAEKMDTHIAKTLIGYKDLVNPTYTTGAKLVAGAAGDGEVNILDFIDNLVQILNERDVTDSTELVLEVTPSVWTKIKKAYKELDTDNSAMLAGRKCGVYNDVKIFKTNSVRVDGNDYVIIRTLDAIGFVNPLNEVEPYRPENGFIDGIKGFGLFQAFIKQPKECIVTKVL